MKLMIVKIKGIDMKVQPKAKTKAEREFDKAAEIATKREIAKARKARVMGY